MADECEELIRLREEAQFLEDELEKERCVNKKLQLNIIGKRIRNDEMCAMMTLLRGETEAVLVRHNVLLETREAKTAAHELHSKSLDERAKRADAMAELLGEDRHFENSVPEFAKSGHLEEDENDGDDEGMEEEDGEIHDQLPNEVVIDQGDDDVDDEGTNE